MRIHITHPTPDSIFTFARHAAGVYHERYDRHGSRSHDTARDVILSGESGRRTNQRWGYGDEGVEAATWDQWGIYLAVIFAADPTAKTPYYHDATDFHHKTGHRFDGWVWLDGTLVPDDERAEGVVVSQDSPDYKITSHRWTVDFGQGGFLNRFSTCKGHGTPRNKRRECSATVLHGPSL